jgi:5-methylcytosine-specific restriction enzyme subunit McrC
MSGIDPVPLELREYERRPLARDDLSLEDGELLWRHHHKRVAVDFPSPQTDGKWRLTPLGWVGFLPVSRTLALRLRPKVPLANLFRMLEVAYELKGFHLLPGLADCSSLEDFYERLANVLAQRVLARGRQGFHREYVGEQDRLLAVRGRIDLGRTLRAAWHPRLDCDFEEHTADVPDNQLLLWTLDRIRRNSACRRTEVRQTVRTAHRRLQGAATPHPFAAADCVGRTYSRLNNDYRTLHALCRFFLEHSGPSHEGGGHRNLPFLVDMAGLFELFVAEWMREALRDTYHVAAQDIVPLDPWRQLRFEIDLVLYDAPGGRPLAVLDTKYKNTGRPSTDDVAQIVAYATAMECREAVLVYPVRLDRPLDTKVGPIHVRALGFPLAGDLDAAGRLFLRNLGLTIPEGP